MMSSNSLDSIKVEISFNVTFLTNEILSLSNRRQISLSGTEHRIQEFSCYPPQLNYWMPIHYDTIKDGQNKEFYLLFSFLVRIVLFLHFIDGIYCKNIITSFILASFE